jgi:hypothetical protein
MLKRNAAHDAFLAGVGALLLAAAATVVDAGVDAVAVKGAAAAAAVAGKGAASLRVISPSRRRRCQYWVTWPMFWPVAGKSFLVPGMGTVRPAVGMAYMFAPM